MQKKHVSWLSAVVVLAAVVGAAATPTMPAVAMTTQQAVEQQEEAARIRADIEQALAELRSELAELRERIAELTDRGRLNAILEARDVQRNIERRQVEEAMARAREAVERSRAQVRALEVEPLGLATSWVSVGGSSRYGNTILELAEELGLTDSQRGQIRDLQRQYRRDEIARDAEIEVAEMDLEGLREQADPDLAGVRAKLEELAALQVEENMARLQLRHDVRQLLTPEQREQLDEIAPTRFDSDFRIRVIR